MLELAKPWREQPVAEALCDPDGRLSVRTFAQRTLRARSSRKGAPIPAQPASSRPSASPEVAAEAAPFLPALGPRFSIEPEASLDRFTFRTRTI